VSDSDDHDIIMANFPPYFIEPTPRKLDWREPVRVTISDEWTTPEFEFEMLMAHPGGKLMRDEQSSDDPHLDDLATNDADPEPVFNQAEATWLILAIIVVTLLAFIVIIALGG